MFTAKTDQSKEQQQHATAARIAGNITGKRKKL